MLKGLMKNRNIKTRRGIQLAALVLLSGCLCGTVRAQTNSKAASPAANAAKPIMHSRVFQWSDIAMGARSTDFATFRDVFDAPTATLDGYSCHVTTLNPGREPHPAHQHPEEELLIIKEGTLEVVQNGVTNQVSAGGMVFCASNELHGWRNSSTNPVTYYVLKVYPHDLAKPAQAAAPKANK
jgi:XRE family transcriptional regulator, regulator of sulfur utilization